MTRNRFDSLPKQTVMAVCCSGPSILETWKPDHQYAQVIAVNAACNVVKPTWAVAGDALAWCSLIKTRPTVGMCTHSNLLDRLPLEIKVGLKVVPWETLRLPNPEIECNYSSVAAIALAVELGADVVHVYGMDMNDQPGIDGDGTTYTNEGRWFRERGMLFDIYQRSTGTTFMRVSQET